MPIIAMACSQTHTVALGMGGTPFGTNLLQLSPDGNCGFTWQKSGLCISVNDLAKLDLNLTFYGSSGTAAFGCNTSNTAFTGAILLHNQVVMDMEGTPTWFPAGGNDNFLFCDGPCEFTIANGVTQGAGSANYIINISETGKGTQSGAISGSSGASANGVYYLFGGMLIISTANASSSTWTGGIGTSKVYGHGTLVSNGITPAGGLSVGTSGVNCPSLTSTC